MNEATKTPAEAKAQIVTETRAAIERCQALARAAGDDWMVALSDQRGERYHFAKRGGISFTALSEFESGAVLRFPSRALAVRHADRFTSPPEGYTVHAVKARTAFEVMIARYFETLRYLDQLAA